MNLDELLKSGYRVQTLRQAFTLREGVDIANNELSGRIVGDPPDEVGPMKGRTIEYKETYEKFCVEMGWSPENGYPLKEKESGKGEKGEDDHITITGTDITFNRDGTIDVDGEETNTLRVVDFKDYSGLCKEGSNCFRNIGGEKNKIELSVGQYEIDQHFLELSGVNVVKEMLQMIDVLRTYESYQKVIQSLDEIDSRATRDVGTVA